MKRSKRSIIAALVIVCVLIGVFFLQGGLDFKKVPTSPEPSPPDTQTVFTPEIDQNTESSVPSKEEDSTQSEPVTKAPDTPSNPSVTLPTDNTPVPEVTPDPDPDPDPDPEPESYPEPEPENQTLTCSLTINCSEILEHMDQLTPGKETLIPTDGWLLYLTDIPFTEGESVFDILKRELTSRSMHLEFSISPVYNTAYVEGICNIYEFDCGETSGWKYNINGLFLGYGASSYPVMDGDVINWVFTCAL